MKYFTLILSFSFLLQWAPNKSCHAKEMSKKEASSNHDSHNQKPMDCHEKESHESSHKKECHGCLSLCCHFVLYSIPYEKLQDNINSYISKNNQHMKNLFEQEFTADNFRPPIFS